MATGQDDGIDFGREKFERFKHAYSLAVVQRQSEFEFEGHLFLTLYAKYVIEYLTHIFKS